MLVEDESYAGEDWYAEEMVDRAYLRCRFSDVDLTEASTQGVRFEECQFFNVRFNASRHTDSAFLRCLFTRANLFEARFDGCKLTGSTFRDSDFRPLTVAGGDWSFVSLVEADLRGCTLTDVRMREADLGRHLLNDRESESGATPAKPDQPADTGPQTTAPRPKPKPLAPGEIVSKDDFQVNQALNHLKGQPVLAKAPQS